MQRRYLLKSLLGLTSLPLGASTLDLEAILGWFSEPEPASQDRYIKDSLQKARDFDRRYEDDVLLPLGEHSLLASVVVRLERLQRLVGHANFNLLDFDSALDYARNYTVVGAFGKTELEFIEKIFNTDATRYGFLGEKVLVKLTDRIAERDTLKISGTGHYLFRGEALRQYQRISKDVGSSVVLTSGIRGVVKQLHLFLTKVMESEGNLSQASRSLAPPGHSFHGVGDFDVGKAGFGADNFTARFAETDEYRRLFELGYVRIRYPEANPFGVRFEPWHVKVV